MVKFVLICQQKNLNFLSAMQTYSKMLADLEVLTAGRGQFEQSFLDSEAEVVADVKRFRGR